MDHLLKELAPISADVWEEINQEAKITLERYLGARRIIDVTGPKGWAKSSKNLGKIKKLSDNDGIVVNQRQVLPMIECRVPFQLDLEELRVYSRGGDDADLSSIVEAAKKAATLEDEVIFYGYKDSDFLGLEKASPYEAISFGKDYEKFPEAISQGLTQLREAGIKGPYALILGAKEYQMLMQSTNQGGYPIIEHIEEMINEPVVWSSALEGGLLVSRRGGDFDLTIGQDFSIGFSHYDATTAYLYLEESFVFHNASPESVIALKKG